MVATKLNEVDHQVLSIAFERFQDASARLEQRHEELQAEIDYLKAQLQEKNKEVKRAERLAVLGETAAGIAHEVRNPLGAISLFASALERYVQEEPEALEILCQIKASVRSLNNVVSNILHCSTDKPLILGPISIDSIIQEQAALLATKTKESVQVSVENKGSKFVIGNEDALRQIFHNLFNNAAQAMSFKGSIKVTICDRDCVGTVVTIADHGPGFPGDMLERAFEPFVTSKNEGTGLGLSIVRRLMSQHRGEVKVFNSNGAVCELVFPRPQVQLPKEKNRNV